MSEELRHHGVKGQKWGVITKVKKDADRFGRAVTSSEKISKKEWTERAVASAATALIAGGLAYCVGKKKWLSSGTKAIATGKNNTRLLTAGAAIAGAFAGFSVSAAKQRYAKDQKFHGMDRAAIKTVRAVQNNPITNKVGYVASKLGKKAYEIERGIFHSEEDSLQHHGVKGQKWGVHRYQNEDGTLTPEGVRRYRTLEEAEEESKKLDKQVEELNSKRDAEAKKLVAKDKRLKLEYDDGDYEALSNYAKKFGLDASKLDELNKSYDEVATKVAQNFWARKSLKQQEYIKQHPLQFIKDYLKNSGLFGK